MASDVHHGSNASLLTAADPPPVTVMNPDGPSPFLLIGDHAGNVIPCGLRELDLGPTDLTRHIAWDIGIGAVGVQLAETLDATFIRQTYSRLVVDCNRRPNAIDAIPAVSDGITVPGNVALPIEAQAARLAAIHEPYHRAISEEIARRKACSRPTIVIALHSFTPTLADEIARPWHIGVLHDGGDVRFARHLLDALSQDADLVVGDNQPYRMDIIDYTVPRHCYPMRLPYAELEVRQDLIAHEEGQRCWANLLTAKLEKAKGLCQPKCTAR